MPSKQETQKQTTAPFKGQIPYIDQQWKEAKRLYGEGGPEYFPYSTVAPLNSYQMQTMDLASQGAAGKLDPVFENVRSKVMPAVDSAYARAGRRPTGAGSYGAVAADALTNAYAPIALQQYNNDFGRLYQSGKDYNQYQQAQVQDARNRWDFYQNQPWDQLARYEAATQLNGNYGSTKSNYSYNPFLQAAGTGLQALPYLFGL